MPVIVPPIEPDETYEEYADRLRELELEPLRRDATEITFDYHADGAIPDNAGDGRSCHRGHRRRGPHATATPALRPLRPADEFVLADGHAAFDPFLGQVARYPSPANPVFLTPPNLGNPSTTLRWGIITGYDADWTGFGYRHIAAKHGWSLADDAATRDALNFSSGTPQSVGVNRRRFVGPQYPSPKDGRPCVRIVSVEYGMHQRPPAARHRYVVRGRPAIAMARGAPPRVRPDEYERRLLATLRGHEWAGLGMAVADVWLEGEHPDTKLVVVSRSIAAPDAASCTAATSGTRGRIQIPSRTLLTWMSRSRSGPPG